MAQDDEKGSHGDGPDHCHTCASTLPSWVRTAARTAASYAQAIQTRASAAFTKFHGDFTDCCCHVGDQAINTWSKFTQLTLPEQCYSVAATAVALAASKYIMSPMGDILSGHDRALLAFPIHASALGNKSEF